MREEALNLLRNEYLYMSDYNQVINSCIKDMFLENGANRRITIEDVNINEVEINKRVRKLPQLIFEITENCNLRCKYCVFNGNYINRRKLSPHNMEFETARKGVDYIFSLIKDRKKKQFTLGFYGGEPLLNIETIKQIVEYSKNRFSRWDLRFNMTTNLTLLTDPILDFLVDNNFSLLVSLDGSRENHDAKRVFSDGRGTHDIVLKKLEKIARRDESYFQKKVGLSAVYSQDLPLENLYKFFTNNDLLKKKWMRFTTVNTYNTTYYNKYPSNRDKYRKSLKRLFTRVLEKVREGEDLSTFESFLYNNFKDIGDSIKVRRYTFLCGSCLFDDRLYLDANGRFHVCEKINSTFPFGDVESGFDFEKMAAMAMDFCQAVKENCSHCAFKFLCNRCFVHFAGDGNFRLDPQFCSDQKEFIINNLEKYIECKEEAIV